MGLPWFCFRVGFGLGRPRFCPVCSLASSTPDAVHGFLASTHTPAGLRALPATAQVANQQGKHLASVFSSATITGDADKDAKLGDKIAPFRWALRTGALLVP